MQTVTIQEKYLEALKAFGEIDELIETALRQFTVEQIAERIKKLRDKVKSIQIQRPSSHSFC